MKLYTTFELNKLVSLIEDIEVLETLAEVIIENNEKYEDRFFFRIMDRIANKHKTLRRIKE
jgi:hypothetical protein